MTLEANMARELGRGRGGGHDRLRRPRPRPQPDAEQKDLAERHPQPWGGRHPGLPRRSHPDHRALLPVRARDPQVCRLLPGRFPGGPARRRPPAAGRRRPGGHRGLPALPEDAACARMSPASTSAALRAGRAPSTRRPRARRDLGPRRPRPRRRRPAKSRTAFRILPVLPGLEPDTDVPLTAEDRTAMNAIWEYARNQLYRPDENISRCRRASWGCEGLGGANLRTTRDLR